MDDAEGVEVLDSKDSLGKIEPCHISREGPHVFQQVCTVSPLHILHHHAKVLPAFEAAVHGDHEGIVCEGHYVSFSKYLLNLVSQNQVVFVYLFQSKSLSGFPVFD